MSKVSRLTAFFLALCLCAVSASCGAPAKTQPGNLHCTVTVSCAALVGNDALKAGKAEFVPTGGAILPQTEIAFTQGETVYDVLRRACKENVCADNCVYCQSGGIQMESAYTPGYGTYYIEGIHQIYEKDCGARSGWLYTVNGETATKGCSEMPVRDGDRIEWVYTTDWNES